MSGRRLAIGDIHGCLRTFVRLLERFEAQQEDTIFLLGDYIDRGPTSRGVLNQLLALADAGYDVRPLRGNHEQLLLDAVHNSEALAIWKGNGGCSTLKDFKVSHPSQLPRVYLDFLASLPFMHLLDDYVLVHAGLDFDMEDPISDSGAYDLLWTRDQQVDGSKLGGRSLVTGHTVTHLFEIENSVNSNHIKLDNGCYSEGESGYGALVALNLDNRELLVVPNCEIER